MLLFYILNVYSVYFLSQLVQMSPLISDSSHNTISLGTMVYGGLYALLLSLALYQISRIPEQNITSLFKILYVTVSHISAVIFALLGEIPFLKNFALTPGFWHRLPLLGKITVAITGLVILIMCIYQLKRSFKRKKLCREFYPWCAMFLTWGAVLTALKSQDAPYTMHIHHALFAGLLATWFWDFTTKFDVIANAIFMGIVIEGVDFYGLSEFHLFIIHYASSVSIIGVIISWFVILILLGILIFKKQRRYYTSLEVPLMGL